MKWLISGGCFLLGLGSGWAAVMLATRTLIPWLQAPQATHATLTMAGVQLTGWQLFIPVTVLVLAAVGSIFLAVRTLGARE